MRYAIVADDDAVSRKILCAKIRQLGIFPIECSDGERAWTTLRDNPEPSLIVADIDMPKLNGRSLIEHARSKPSLASIPIVIVSGSVRMGEISDLITSGTCAFVPKPIDSANFALHVEHLLGGKKA